MALLRISLMDAYMIETLRSYGISNQEILAQVKQKDVHSWKNINSDIDFNELLKLADLNLDDFQSILLRGYQVKFVTFNGMKNLIKLRFGKVPDIDYELVENGIKNLSLQEEQLHILKQMLSPNWKIEENYDTINILLSL
ncbi:hypothetical protein [Ferdinandcohnia sp. Marseille-Q9671]